MSPCRGSGPITGAVRCCLTFHDLLMPALVSSPDIPSNPQVVQTGNKLRFTRCKQGNLSTVTLGEVLSREPAAIGRSTVVLTARSDEWKGVPLVVKVS